MVDASSGITDRKGSGKDQRREEEAERGEGRKEEDSCTFHPQTTPCAHYTRSLSLTISSRSVPSSPVFLRSAPPLQSSSLQSLHRLRKSPPPIFPAPNQPKGVISRMNLLTPSIASTNHQPQPPLSSHISYPHHHSRPTVPPRETSIYKFPHSLPRCNRTPELLSPSKFPRARS